MKVYRISNKNYYLHTELVDEFPHLKKGARSKAAFIKKHTLKDSQYVFARIDKEDIWQISDGKSKKCDKLFVRKKHADNNMISTKKKAVDPKPDLLELADDEGFYDADGNKLDIEILRDWKHRELYFNLKDLGTVLQMPSLSKTVTHSRHNGYREGVHYERLEVSGETKIYLNTFGLLRCTLLTMSKRAKILGNVIAEILFNNQFRHTSSRDSGLFRVLVDFEHDDDESTAEKKSCIYLFKVGTVEDLRISMAIPEEYEDDDLVCKWGRTSNIDRRTKEHLAVYGEIPGSDFQLIHSSIIDYYDAIDAERDVSKMLGSKDLLFRTGSFKELAIVPRDIIEDVIDNYDTISQSYLSKYVQAQDDNIMEPIYEGNLRYILDDLEKQKHLTEMANQKIEMVQKDVVIAKQEIEILRLKLQLAHQPNQTP